MLGLIERAAMMVVRMIAKLIANQIISWARRDRGCGSLARRSTLDPDEALARSLAPGSPLAAGGLTGPSMVIVYTSPRPKRYPVPITV